MRNDKKSRKSNCNYNCNNINNIYMRHLYIYLLSDFFVIGSLIR